jgi:hypothetical protein
MTTHLDLARKARGQFRRWAADVANGKRPPANRDLLHVGAVLRVQQPAVLLEHLAEVARQEPAMIGLGEPDDVR